MTGAAHFVRIGVPTDSGRLGVDRNPVAVAKDHRISRKPLVIG